MWNSFKINRWMQVRWLIFFCLWVFLDVVCRQRLRPSPNHSVEVLEKRVLLEKQWAKYKFDQHLADIRMIERMFNSQQKALDELRKESEELYQEAIQVR